ncbi:hypothetical protein F4779DRAFT_614823 [Xylariaceae sp. FL0662B]|nr:hypothetical protein F4779DRAFT_614823 [Xylariaceae sp. FL0662B]
MRLNQAPYLVALAASQLAAGEEAHGEGLLGTIMGPVAFLWPENRPWSASADNVAPCGSSSGVGNRTVFPLHQGSVALSIADDAWNVAFAVSYDNVPTTQSQFTQQVVSNVSEVEPGHQCYKIAEIPNSVRAGTNATIQLEYWSNVDDELNGRNQSFYACADIKFVEDKDFNLQVPCFNVTVDDFTAPSPSSSTTEPSSTDESSVASPPASGSSGDGLSGGQKAGIAVGVIAASFAVVGVIAYVVLRKRKSRPTDQEASAHPSKGMPEVSSVNDEHH